MNRLRVWWERVSYGAWMRASRLGFVRIAEVLDAVGGHQARRDRLRREGWAISLERWEAP